MIRKPTRRPKKGNFAFVDSQNLNMGTQKMGWKLDWAKFLKFLQQQHGVTKAYLFIGYVPEYEDMYNQLHDLGYLIVLKPTLEVHAAPRPAEDATKPEGEVKEKPAVKGNIDADLVLYAMKEIPNYDKAIIVTGDGDFFGLVEYLGSLQKLHKIMTPNWQYSSLLKPFESYIIRLDQMRRELSYRDFARKRRPVGKPKPTA